MSENKALIRYQTCICCKTMTSRQDSSVQQPERRNSSIWGNKWSINIIFEDFFE